MVNSGSRRHVAGGTGAWKFWIGTGLEGNGIWPWHLLVAVSKTVSRTITGPLRFVSKKPRSGGRL
jgi:hypothetical protein